MSALIRQLFSESVILIKDSGWLFWLHKCFKFIRRELCKKTDNFYFRFVQRAALNNDEIRELEHEWQAGFSGNHPLICLIIHLQGKGENDIVEYIHHMQRQIYPYWQLLVLVGHGQKVDQGVMHKAVAADSRVKTIHVNTSWNMCELYNYGIRKSDGDYIIFVNMQTRLAKEALDHVARSVRQIPAPDIIYGDEDKLGILGTRKEALFLPAYSPALFLQIFARIHFLVYRKSLLLELGGFDHIKGSAQFYDLALRASEHARFILHIPRVLCHVRPDPGYKKCYVEGDVEGINTVEINILKKALIRRNICAEIKGNLNSAYLITRRPSKNPMVSIIIPMRDKIFLLEKLLETFYKFNPYQNHELIIVDNGSVEEETRSFLKRIKTERNNISVIKYNGSFNFSKLINMGVQTSSGDYLLLLNNDIEFIHSHSLEPMIAHAEERDVGAVGALLFYPDGTIQHAGVGVGIKKGVQHLFAGKKYKTVAATNRGVYLLDREVSVVTAACMMIRRNVYVQSGGLDEERFKVSFNDVDLCLRLRSSGYRIIMCASSRFMHHESKSRARDSNPEEIAYLKKIWCPEVYVDPYINPNFSRSSQHLILGQAWKYPLSGENELVPQKIEPPGGLP